MCQGDKDRTDHIRQVTFLNYDNLHELINRYEEKIDKLYGTEHYELFKWEAVKTWRDEWFKPEDSFACFGARFSAARKGLGWFMDNSRMHPSSGVVKLWEKEPKTVERLFYDVLFAKTRDVRTLQNQMDAFITEYEALRQKYFPGNWSYKHDRHSVSIFLAMNDPDFNYVFKSSEAHAMARYTDFGFTIGSGGSFSLENYYRLCDQIVSALKEHTTLLEKHFSKLSDKCYKDESLHLLAFDLMYCCNTYGYYKGLVAPTTGKTIKKARKTAEPIQMEPDPVKEAKKAARIQALEQELADLEQSISEFVDISLIGVQVTSDKYGIGTVIGQVVNKVTVRFSDTEKSFVLDQRFSGRPRFEDDEEIVAVFTEYGRTQEKMKKIRKELDMLLA